MRTRHIVTLYVHYLPCYLPVHCFSRFGVVDFFFLKWVLVLSFVRSYCVAQDRDEGNKANLQWCKSPNV